jgi:putative transposase
MKKGRLSETQIVKALQEEQAGRKADDICRELGISRATFYNWKIKYSGMEVSQLKQLCERQEENRKLKRMYDDLALDHRILKEIVEKKL